MSDAGGVGGSANEMGSRHRAGVAAYLAVHGLVDRPVLGRVGAVPVAIILEAAEAVDDIVCRMVNASSWYLQSKRVAGNDAALRSAVRQWAAQSLDKGDRVALVSRDLKGLLAGLQRAIEQVVRGDPLPQRLRSDVTIFEDVLRNEGVAAPEDFLSRVQLVEWRVEQAGDADLATAVAMLAGAIVPHSQAEQAFETLRQRMQLAASRREATTPEDWISCLVAAGHDVFADGDGPRGARERAQALAIDAYRARLAVRANHLDLSTLVTDVPEIIVENALRGWDVSWDADNQRRRSSTSVLNVVRATPRIVIAGLPGMGKSELMRQLAAHLAADELAPLPIHIDLRDITGAVRRADDLTLDLLLDRPSRSVTGQDPEVLKAALTDAVVKGAAILQIDGLDEAQRARGQVGAGIARLLTELPDGTGLILTTRDSALPAAAQLNLPLVRLETPGNLKATMLQLIAALAPPVLGSAAKAEWVATKSEELTAAYDRHEDVWGVPLLATLATVRLALGREATTSVAVLLNQVIQDSVAEWELRRKAGRDDLNPALNSDMLLAGFAALGHELVAATSIDPAGAVKAVRESLADWRLPPPVENTLALDIVAFWDDRVGIFVNNGEGIAPRSRQFAELAEVRWLTARGEAARREWLRLAVEDDGYENSVSLASTVDAAVRVGLIERASRANVATSRDRAASWVARQWRTWPDDLSQQRQVIDVLADAAEDRLAPTIQGSRIVRSLIEHQQRSDGPGWEFVLALVCSPLHPDIDSHRRERLAGLELDSGRRSVVTALTGLLDAEYEERPLDNETLAAVEQIISTRRPKRAKPRHNDEGVLVIGSSPNFITGVGDVAERSIAFLDQLGSNAPESIHHIARQQSMRQYGRIHRRLLALGHQDPDPLGSGIEFPTEWLAIREDLNGLGWLLRALDQLSPADLPEANTMWRYPQLGALIAALDYGEASLGGFTRAANEESAVLQAWLRGHIEAFQLDPQLVAREARHLLAARDAEAASDSIMFGRRQPEEEPVTLSEAAALAMVPLFESASEWIVNTTFRLLAETTYPSVAYALAALIHAAPWRSRFERHVAIILNSSDREAAVLARIDDDDTAVRSAAGGVLAGRYVSRADLLARLQRDIDGQVRYYSDGAPRDAQVWTCSWCEQVSSPNSASCSRCHINAPWR